MDHTYDVGDLQQYLDAIAAEQRGVARPRDECPHCGTRMHLHDATAYRCDCGYTIETGEDLEAPDQPDPPMRLCFRGAGVRGLQGELEKGAVAPYSKIQERAVFRELQGLNVRYIQRAGRPFLDNVLRRAAEIYAALDETARSDNKRRILGTCIDKAGVELYHKRSNRDIKDLLELNRGFSVGEQAFVGHADVAAGANELHSRAAAEIEKCFVFMGLPPKDSELAREVRAPKERATALVERSFTERPAMTAYLATRAAAAVAAVLAGDAPIGPIIAQVCTANHIRAATVKKVMPEFLALNSD